MDNAHKEILKSLMDYQEGYNNAIKDFEKIINEELKEPSDEPPFSKETIGVLKVLKFKLSQLK